MTSWIFEPGHTEAEFRARHMMVTWVRGLFKDIHGSLEFDWDSCLESTFSGRIDATKLWTGEPERDAHLRSALRNALDRLNPAAADEQAKRQEIAELLPGGKRRELAQKRDELKLEREAVIKAIPTVMIMQDLPEPRRTYLLKRGRYDSPDESEALPPDVPAFDPTPPVRVRAQPLVEARPEPEREPEPAPSLEPPRIVAVSPPPLEPEPELVLLEMDGRRTVRGLELVLSVVFAWCSPNQRPTSASRGPSSSGVIASNPRWASRVPQNSRMYFTGRPPDRGLGSLRGCRREKPRCAALAYGGRGALRPAQHLT